jgi:hypothetical protein
MSYDNLSSVSQNVLKFYQQLTGEERRVPFSFLVGTNSNVLVMEIGWTNVGSGGYILVSCAHSNTSFNFYFYKEKLHTNGFLSILQEEFLPCPVHPALFLHFGCCYIILMGHKKIKIKMNSSI